MAVSAVVSFRRMLRRALFLSPEEGRIFDKLPDVVFEGVFKHNFNGNLELARRIVFNEYRDVDRIDRVRLDREKENIAGLEASRTRIMKAIADRTPLVFITDNDNDGSLAQSVLREFVKTLTPDDRALVHIEYAQPIGKSRGFTKEMVDLIATSRDWSLDQPMLLITADNGINNRSEQKAILESYTRADLIVTDHHLPIPDMVIEEDARSLIVNPKHKPTPYFTKKNIAGANVLGVVLRGVVEKYQEALSEDDRPDISEVKQALANMEEIGSWANLLDYANADIADMPIRPYVTETALSLRPLMNVATSMSNIITHGVDEEAIASLEGSGLDVAKVRHLMGEVKDLNEVSRRLLLLEARSRAVSSGTYDEKEFYELLSGIMTEEIPPSTTDINPNYLEQLRPVVFQLSAIDNKDPFAERLCEIMVKTFEELRRIERNLLTELRQHGLLREERGVFSSIRYPTHPGLTQLFNRRLLGKAYNESNPGFLLILNEMQSDEMTGSLRSLYPVSEILKEKEHLEKRLGIDILVQGHEMAAGMKITARDGKPLTQETLSTLNTWISDKIGVLRAEDAINQVPHVEVDFGALRVMNKINAAIKANLAGMWEIPTLMPFSPPRGGEGVWITDNVTAEQKSLSDIVATKRYGYQAIQTDFHGGAVVAPIEMLRGIVESGYRKLARVSYMDDGVYMVNDVVDRTQVSHIVSAKAGRRDQENLVEYYQNNFTDTVVRPMTREDFRASPYFKFNQSGESEFALWESMVLRVLEDTETDALVVLDTEGTGLGKAPKCFNLGGVVLRPSPTSGRVMSAKEFDAGSFRASTGEEYWLTPEERAALPVWTGSSSTLPADAKLLYASTLEDGMKTEKTFLYVPGDTPFLRVTNHRIDDETGKVYVNKELEGEFFSFLVKNDDFAITPELEELTGISNWMAKKAGMSAKQADAIVCQYLEGLKNEEGNPARMIFAAHNLPYDKGVIAANFNGLNGLLESNLMCDTAKLAREAKLAYDETPVVSFDNVEGLPPRVYFYNSPYSNYSMGTFLDWCGRGHTGVYPDTTSKMLLRYTAKTDRFSLIDRSTNTEVMLEESLETLAGKMKHGSLPNNAVRYSVERMSLRAMVRNILLHERSPVKLLDLTPEEKPFEPILRIFQERYHFDSPPALNQEHFMSMVSHTAAADQTAVLEKVDLEAFTRRFLQHNQELQARFHDGWVYEKVLSWYMPPADKATVPADIIEQINYLTDVPARKIREVFKNTIAFQRAHGITDALIHEQHNNIRYTSEDGQGLADVVYEAVLPLHLCAIKFMNPYFKSTHMAVNRFVEANVARAMVQAEMRRVYRGDVARDSFSAIQMNSFHRHGKTDIVKEVQRIIETGTKKAGDTLEEVKLKLATDLLPPDSAVYVRPRRHLSPEEITQLSEDIGHVVMVEQVKSATLAANNLNGAHKNRIMSLACAHDSALTESRDRVMNLAESVTFERRDGIVKKISDWVLEAYKGEPFKKFPRGFTVDATIRDLAIDVVATQGRVLLAAGQPAMTVEVEGFLEAIEQAYESYEAGRETPAQTCTKKTEEEEEVAPVTPPVRNAAFLPNLDIKRVEPLKFCLAKMGVGILLPWIREAQAKSKAQAELRSRPTP